MRQYRPLPANFEPAPTLARRVFQLREFRNLTVYDLARLCRFKIERIEDIESGLETWFSATDRQLIAKALGVEPSFILEVESRPNLNADDIYATEKALSQLILNGARNIECPKCAGTLNCRIENAFDIEGRTFQIAKAFCLQCSFVIR